MTNATHEGGRLAAVLGNIATQRGLTLADVADEARRQGHAFTPAEILDGQCGFGLAVDAVLRLGPDERRSVVAAAVADWGARLRGDVPVAPPGTGAGAYGEPGVEYRRENLPACCVSHPDAGGPCPEPAVLEVWSLPFCMAHGGEARAAALAEMWEDAHAAAREALDAARPRWQQNAAALEVFRSAERDASEIATAHAAMHEDAAHEVYGDAPDSATDPETLSYNGDEFAGGPWVWWRDSRNAIVRAMRESHEAGLRLTADLEPLREQATVQEILAVRREFSTPPA